MPETWRAALIQTTSGLDPARSAADLAAAVGQAAEQDAALISTPEMSNFLPANRGQAMELAVEEGHDPVLAALRDAASKTGRWVHIGSLCLKAKGDKLINRGFLIDPGGVIQARYDKIHMFDVDLGGGESYRESALYQPGSQAVLCDTPFGALGLTICYDLRFPQLYETLAQAGAQVILVPAAFTQPTGDAHWETLLRARAIENGCYILAAGQTGVHESKRKTHGHSMVVDPWGRVITALDRQPGILYCDVDMTQVAQVRGKIPSLTHRRSFELVQG